MRISDITPDVLFRAYAARGWKPFTEGDYNLNIIGIRADITNAVIARIKKIHIGLLNHGNSLRL